jgi:hypothetical protein
MSNKVFCCFPQHRSSSKLKTQKKLLIKMEFTYKEVLRRETIRDYEILPIPYN